MKQITYIRTVGTTGIAWLCLVHWYYRPRTLQLQSWEVQERIAILIYELIEGQLGDTHSIQKFKPAPNSPGYTLAEAIWYVDIYPFIEE